MKTHSITLKYDIDDEGEFRYLKLLKGRAQVPDDILDILNAGLEDLFISSMDEPVVKQITVPTAEPAATQPKATIEPVKQTTVPTIEPAATQPKATTIEPVKQNMVPTIEPVASQVVYMQQPPIQIVDSSWLRTPTKSSAKLGKDAEVMIMDYLLNVSSVNADFEVDDTSNLKSHGDIAVRYQGRRICIEIKNYQSRVPVKEIEKYRKSISLPEYDAGLMIQINKHGFASQEGIRSPIDLRFEHKKPSAYLTACDVEMIYPVIMMLMANMSVAVDESKFEVRRKALLTINEKITKLRKVIDTQKRSITTIESTIDTIVKLSIL